MNASILQQGESEVFGISLSVEENAFDCLISAILNKNSTWIDYDMLFI